MKLSKAETEAYMEVVRAAAARKNMDPAMDQLMAAVRTAMPCYRTWLDDGAVCIPETTDDGPRRCPACEAQAAASMAEFERATPNYHADRGDQ